MVQRVNADAMAVVMDVDPGHDDALAILLAYARPEIDLRAITVVAGNQTLPKTLRNCLQLCTVAGITDVPIAAGAAAPMLRPQEIAPEVHGESGLEGPQLPEPTIAPQPMHAVDLIARVIRESDRPVTLIPTGPLTNIALFLLKYPELKERIAQICLMGGAITEGNKTPSAEFNIYVDPEAARIVFNAGLPLTMIGLDVTHKALITPAHSRHLRETGGTVATVVADLLDFFTLWHDEVYQMGGAPLHDPCAVAQVIQPGIVTTRHLNVDVEVHGELTAGRTVVDLWKVTGKEPNVHVGVDLDTPAFVTMLLDAVQSYDV
ncbi:MAG: nucleoside hydrolase [Thermomicrobiales bacterium]